MKVKVTWKTLKNKVKNNRIKLVKKSELFCSHLCEGVLTESQTVRPAATTADLTFLPNACR